MKKSISVAKFSRKTKSPFTGAQANAIAKAGKFNYRSSDASGVGGMSMPGKRKVNPIGASMPAATKRPTRKAYPDIKGQMP